MTELPLILASTSSSRRQLLKRLEIPFLTVAPHVDETPLPGESPAALVARLAEAKARAVARHHPAALIIGSDQVAILGEQILGKPGDHAAAVAQLRLTSGHSLRFLNGLVLLNSASGHLQQEVIPFTVHMRSLEAAQIERYLQREQPYQCAGSFKSEALGIALFDRLEGDDPAALIGLPLIRLVRMLEKEGVQIL